MTAEVIDLVVNITAQDGTFIRQWQGYAVPTTTAWRVEDIDRNTVRTVPTLADAKLFASMHAVAGMTYNGERINHG